jgi:hypothetical protein
MDCCAAGDSVKAHSGRQAALNVEDALAHTATDVPHVLEVIGACHWSETTPAFGPATFTIRLATVMFELRQHGSNLNTMAINTALFRLYRAKNSRKPPFHFSMRGGRPVNLGPLYKREFKCVTDFSSLTSLTGS